MKAPIANFIPLSRKLFNHGLWLEKRPYSRFEAWLDLIATARFDNSEARMLIGNSVVRWQRGQLVASLRYLAVRWGWSKSKVERFTKMLQTENMIKTGTADGTGQTIITICNYETYNPISKKTDQQTGQQRDSDETDAGHHRDKTNIANTEQNSKNRAIYRGFAHLVLFDDEYLKLVDTGYAQNQIDEVLDAIENYKGNKKYASLYLTAKKWLARDGAGNGNGNGSGSSSSSGSKNSGSGGRIVNIANAFERALQHG